MEIRGNKDFTNTTNVVIVNSNAEVKLAIQKLTLFLDTDVMENADETREHMKRTLGAAQIPVNYTLKSSWFVEDNKVCVLTREGVKRIEFNAMVWNKYYTILLTLQMGKVVSTMLGNRLCVNTYESDVLTKQQQAALHTFTVNAWQPITLQSLKRYGFDLLMPEDIGEDNDEWADFNVVERTLTFKGRTIGTCTQHHRNEKRVIAHLDVPIAGKTWILVNVENRNKAMMAAA